LSRAVISAQFSEKKWPIRAVEALNRQSSGGRTFHDLSWGGYLIFFTNPSRKVFIDDRFELYGRELVQAYRNALAAGPVWEQLLGKYEFRYVLVSPRAPLADLLRGKDGWKVIHADATAVLLARDP